jgi:hypothetical protein
MSEREALLDNDFWVLGLPADASRIEIERAGQKLLAQLAIGAASAKIYRTPFGPRALDEALVRGALAALRDPERRVLAELWAAPALAEEDASAPIPPWTGAWRSLGWNPRR